MSRPTIADELREYADYLKEIGEMTDYYLLTNIADEIDAEHRRRMHQQSHDIRKAACRYLAGVVEDYKHGKKRKRQ